MTKQTLDEWKTQYTVAVHKNFRITLALLPNSYLIVRMENFISNEKKCFIENPDGEKVKDLDCYDVFTEERLQFYYNWTKNYKEKIL